MDCSITSTKVTFNCDRIFYPLTISPFYRIFLNTVLSFTKGLTKFSVSESSVMKNNCYLLCIFFIVCFVSSSGVHLEALAHDLSGTVVREIDPNGAVARDGRLRSGDLVLYWNHESMWRVTSSQAKIILRRAEFVTTGIP